MPVLIAIGIVSILAAMSLTNAMTSRMIQKKVIRKLNRMEGFYTSELAAWHNYYRTRENIVTSGQNVGEGISVAIDSKYTDNISDLSPDPYSTIPGDALNLAATLPYAPTTNIIRRYIAGSAVYQSTVGDYCGVTSFHGSKSRVRICLAGKISKKLVEPWIKATLDMACALLPNKGVQCWGTSANGHPNLMNNDIAEYFPSPVWMRDLKGLDSGGSPTLSLEPTLPHSMSGTKDGIALIWGKTLSHQMSFNLPNNVIQSIGAGAAAGQEVGVGGRDAALPVSHILRSDGTIQFLGIDTNWTWSPTHCGSQACWKDVPGISDAVMISTSIHHGCAILRSGGVKCWGNFLGRGTSVDPLKSNNMGSPVDVPNLNGGVIQLIAAQRRTCALNDLGVWCWGLGEPEMIKGFPGVPSAIALDLEGWKGFAVVNDEIYSFGSELFDPDGEEGSAIPYYSNSIAIKTLVPKLPKNIEFVTTAAEYSYDILAHYLTSLDSQFACVSTTDKEVWCWGAGKKGQLGNGQLQNSEVAVKVNDWEK